MNGQRNYEYRVTTHAFSAQEGGLSGTAPIAPPAPGAAGVPWSLVQEGTDGVTLSLLWRRFRVEGGTTGGAVLPMQSEGYPADNNQVIVPGRTSP